MLLHFAKKMTPLFLAALCFSCADNIFEEFSVKSSFLEKEKVCVVFSSSPDPSSVKENFLFTEDDVQVGGEMFFLENVVSFVPVKKISQNHSYKIQVFCGTKDKMGNTLQRDYLNAIHTKSDLSRPSVLHANAGGGALEIQFNKAINKQSFLDNFSVEPQKDFFVRWDEAGSKVEIEFKAPLAERKLHSIKIQSGLLDEFNNKMENDFYWSWTNEPLAPVLEYSVYGFCVESGKKEILNEIFEGADFDKDFEIVFNKDVDSEILSGAIFAEEDFSLETKPLLGPQGKYCSSSLIKFKTKPRWGQEALLCVSQRICDKSDGRAQERKIKLKNNAEEKRPPMLEFVALKADGKFIAMDTERQWADISFPVDKYPEGAEKELPLYFVYSISAKAQKIDRLSAMEATRVLANSCAAIRLRTLETKSESEFLSLQELLDCQEIKEKILALKAQGKTLSLVQCGATFSNRQKNERPARGVIEFRVSQKLCDDRKNFMEEEALFACNKD